MAGKVCRVSLKDLDGVRHTVDVVAESVYEAAAQALAALSKHQWVDDVGPGTRLDIEIIEPPVTHTLLVAQAEGLARPTGEWRFGPDGSHSMLANELRPIKR